MKRIILTLLVALVAGAAAYCLTRTHQMAVHRSVLLDSMPELAWVKSELKLTDDQFAKVSVLHTAYRPKCADMCGRIAAAHEKAESLIHKTPELTPELEQAIEEHAALHVEGQKAMLNHIFQTAGAMNHEQAARYLKEVLPFALDFSHSDPGETNAR